MDVIRFAFGDQPQIDEVDASDLGGSLSSRRTEPATQVVGKIDAELQKLRWERKGISLTRLQLEALISVLTEDLPTMRQPRPPLEHLLEEARSAHARGKWGPDGDTGDVT